MKYSALVMLAAALLPLGSASAQKPSLEQRLQRVEDELAIKRVVLEYAVKLDARDFDGYVALFAKDGTWQNGTTVKHGHDEIRQMLVGIYGNPPPGYVNTDSYRIVSNVLVDIDGDHATAHSRQLTIMRGENGTPTPRLSGIYDDELVREDGEWKILHRIDRTIMPSPEQWRQQMTNLKATQDGK
ncbi:MAG TPA: nuclear transport factor 2 family protein [Sphingomonas sp.]